MPSGQTTCQGATIASVDRGIQINNVHFHSSFRVLGVAGSTTKIVHSCACASQAACTWGLFTQKGVARYARNTKGWRGYYLYWICKIDMIHNVIFYLSDSVLERALKTGIKQSLYWVLKYHISNDRKHWLSIMFFLGVFYKWYMNSF